MKIKLINTLLLLSLTVAGLLGAAAIFGAGATPSLASPHVFDVPTEAYTFVSVVNTDTDQDTITACAVPSPGTLVPMRPMAHEPRSLPML
ncbi:MAG: hypothetical protein O2826_07135, partial [Chloroflexi bacterium]|nr:hypothetical protein [Chloroflexota bacterium]